MALAKDWFEVIDTAARLSETGPAQVIKAWHPAPDILLGEMRCQSAERQRLSARIFKALGGDIPAPPTTLKCCECYKSSPLDPLTAKVPFAAEFLED